MRYCAYCEYNDGCIYTSLPPQYKCTITGEFHFGDHPCSVEFAPVKHGRWMSCSSSEHYKCSCCGTRASFWFDEENSSEWQMDMSEWLSAYCPNCGAKMDETVDE